MLERRVVQRRHVPQPHRADVGDDAERRVRERPGGALDPVDAARDRAQDPLRQREREADRRDVGEQQVLDHVRGRELLAEPVDRRDQRDEQRSDPGPPQRSRPSAARRARRPRRGRCASGGCRRSRRPRARAARSGAKVHDVSTGTAAASTSHWSGERTTAQDGEGPAPVSSSADTRRARGRHADSPLYLPAVERREGAIVAAACGAARAVRACPAAGAADCTACRAARRARCCAPRAPARCRGCAARLPSLRAAARTARGGCPAAGAAFALAWAPLAYEGVARELVQALKFRGALPVAQLMAAQVAAGLPPALRGVDAVVPVPPHPGRRRRRGFDPAGVLARALAARLGLPLAACLARGGGRRQVGAGGRSGATRTGSRSRARGAAAARAARRRRPHHRRDARRVRACARRRRQRLDRGGDLREDAVSGASGARSGDRAAGVVGPLERRAVGAGERDAGRLHASGTRRARTR